MNDADLERAFAELRERERYIAETYARHTDSHARTMRRMLVLFALATLFLGGSLIVSLVRLFVVCP